MELISAAGAVEPWLIPSEEFNFFTMSEHNCIILAIYIGDKICSSLPPDELRGIEVQEVDMSEVEMADNEELRKIYKDSESRVSSLPIYQG